MNITIIATKQCSHRADLTKELDDLGVEYQLVYAEDAPDLVRKLSIRHSPNLVLDGEVVFRRLPTPTELRECLKR